MLVHNARNCPGVWVTRDDTLVCNGCGARSTNPSTEDMARAKAQNLERITGRPNPFDREPGTRG